MEYFNYYKKAKHLIEEGALIDFEVVEGCNHISPALVLVFKDGTTLSIRKERWQEYFILIKKHYPHYL
jgi:hypothetical protein